MKNLKIYSKLVDGDITLKIKEGNLESNEITLPINTIPSVMVAVTHHTIEDGPAFTELQLSVMEQALYDIFSKMDIEQPIEEVVNEYIDMVKYGVETKLKLNDLRESDKN